MKTLMLAAALAVLASPAFAQDANVPPPPMPPIGEAPSMLPPGNEKMSLDEIKAKMAEHKSKRAEFEAKMEANRKSMDAHRDDCYNKMQAAGTKEELKSIVEKCRAEGKKMHEARRAEMGGKRPDFRAARDAAKAKAE